MYHVERPSRCARHLLALLLAAGLSCGEDGAASPPAPDAGEPSGGSGGSAEPPGCVPDETRPCGSDGCAGVQRCITTATGGTTWQPCDVSGAFSDPALLAAVRGQLRVPAVDPLFELSTRQLRQLSAAEAGISSLEGMQCLSSLGSAELFSNAIADVTPLAPLTELVQLTLQDNAIVDIAPLAGLTQLQSLLLHINQISDIQPLAGLTGLRQLSLDENRLSDIAPLSGLTRLEQLYLGLNQLSDLSAIAPLRQLTLLQLSDNAFTDLAPLGELSALVSLLADGNQLTDVTPLVGLPALQGVALERNPLDCASESLAALRMRLVSLTSDCP